MFTGFAGSSNVNQCDEQSVFPEEGSKNFLSVLNNIMNAACLEGGATGAGDGVAAQQACIQDIYPLILGLFQNITNTNARKGEDAGVVNKDPSQKQSNGKDESGNAGSNNAVEIDLNRADAAYIQALFLVLDNLSETMRRDEIDFDIEKVIEKNLSDDVFISVENTIENIKEGKDGQFLSDGLTEIGQKREVVNPVPYVSQQLPENITTVAAADNVYFKSEQSFENKSQIEVNHISSLKEMVTAKEKVPEEYFIYGELSRESKTLSASSGDTRQKPGNDMDGDVRNNIEILAKSISNAVKQEEGSNKESFFTKNRQSDPDAGYPENNENDVQTFFAQMGKQSDKLIITQKKDVPGVQDKDLKLLFKDSNDYLSLSKQDNLENTLIQEAQGHKVAKEAPVTSVMTDRIEKIVEQYIAKGPSMDMIVRLKINDKDTLLVGLKNDGQKVMVDIRTTDGGIINILQTQKDDIVRNLEEKNIYTNIFVDPDGAGNFERREARQENRRNSRETAKQKDFLEFLETSVQGGA
jgi:hypothetical protein